MISGRFSLLHPPSFEPGELVSTLGSEGIPTHTVETVEDLASPGDGAVLLLDPPSRQHFPASSLEPFTGGGGAVVLLGAPGEGDVPHDWPDDSLAAFVPHPHGRRQLILALRGAFQGLLARREVESRGREIDELTGIGSALSTERDLDALLRLILEQARRLTGADAGSLYLAEEGEDGSQRLRFVQAQNHSRPGLGLEEFTVPLDDRSLAGAVATSREPSLIDDAYHLGDDVPYGFDASFDAKHGYRTRSVLTLPMKNARDEVIGVLQLINRKRDFDALLASPDAIEAQVLPFTGRDVELALSLASQAAVAIENSRLHESIERLFEGFVTAAVTAIEQRDPTTSGHSQRVADMTVALAQTVDHLSTGPYGNVSFNRDQLKELRYAGLLHDFGKVGVSEQVLVKAKKLYPAELDLIEQRFAFVRRGAELEFYKRRTQHLERHGQEDYARVLESFEADYRRRLDLLDRLMGLVRSANEPTVLLEGNFEDLVVLGQSQYEDMQGRTHPLLGEHELRCLTLRKGSLGREERREIESHVVHTYRFLSQIPWTRDLQNVPQIAYGHHEKLNGGGYPRSVGADDIPIQTRMMTIADIFDALTAADRPYKKAVSTERALDILQGEVEDQMLDGELFRIFLEARVYEGG